MIEKFLLQNPFRVLGVYSNSGIKLIHKNLSKIRAYSKLNKKIEFENDFPSLNYRDIIRSTNTIKKVENSILLDEDKFRFSLFWFQEISSYDSIALANLIKGKTTKAIDIWSKLVKSGELNSKNFSAFNNLSTLMLLNVIDASNPDRFKNNPQSISDLRIALDYKIKLINSDSFKDFKNSIGIVSDINIVEIQTSMAEILLESLGLSFSNPEILNIIKDLDESFSGIISNNLVKEPVSNIKEQIKNASEQINENEKNGVSVGKALIIKTVSDIGYLKKTLGTEHYQYQTIVDKLCNEIIQCGIVCFNSTADDQEYLSSYKYALSLALNEKTKTRAKDCVKHCEEEKGAKICKFCNENEVLTSTGIKVKMHKMTSYSAYSYFKDGGLELKCCRSCKNKKTTNKFLSPILATIIYVAIAIVTSGILVFIDFLFTRFAIAEWWFKLINKEIYFKNIAKHPLILSTLKEGYKFGTP